ADPRGGRGRHARPLRANQLQRHPRRQRRAAPQRARRARGGQSVAALRRRDGGPPRSRGGDTRLPPERSERSPSGTARAHGCEGGFDASAEDLDGDGKRETVKLLTSRFGGGQAVFIDLNEDDDKVPRTAARPFAAEVVVFSKGDEVFAWYDTDVDGRFDVFVR